MKPLAIPFKYLRLILVAFLVTLGACGDDDGDSTSVNVEAPQEEDVPGGTPSGPTVNVNVRSSAKVNNKIDNDVRVNSTTKIQRQSKTIIFVWRVQNADPVVHQQWIHKGDRCPNLSRDDLNDDGFIDEQELQQTVGPRLIPLQLEATYPSGATYVYTRTFSLTELWKFVPPGESFVVVYYGVSPDFALPATYLTVSEGAIHQNVPFYCVEYLSPPNPDATEDEGVGTDDTGDTEGPVEEQPEDDRPSDEQPGDDQPEEQPEE